MKRRRWLLLLTVVALALIVLAGRAIFGPRDRVWARIQETGVWRVALDPSFPPFENVDADGRIAGLDPDLARAIAAQWGVRVEIVSLGFDELLDAVVADRVDSAISALPLVAHRTEELHFSEPYVDAGLVLAVPLSSPVATTADLAGMRLAAEWGSAGDAAARALQDQAGGALQLVLRDTMAAALAAVVAGDADAAVVDAITLALYERRDALRTAGDPLTHEPYVVVLSAYAPELENAINAALRSLTTDGTLDALRARWLRP